MSNTNIFCPEHITIQNCKNCKKLIRHLMLNFQLLYFKFKLHVGNYGNFFFMSQSVSKQTKIRSKTRPWKILILEIFKAKFWYLSWIKNQT